MPWLPESPRWLIFHDRHEEALDVIAAAEANGNKTDAVVLAQYKEIADTLRFEKEFGKTVSLKTMFNTPSSRKRIMLALSVAVCAILSGMWTFSSLLKMWSCNLTGSRQQHCVLLSLSYAGQCGYHRHDDAARDCKKDPP